MRRQSSILLTLLLSLILANSSHAQQLTVTSARFTPMVVDASQPASVVLEARISGTPSSVRLMLVSTGKEVLLSDDGAAPDKVAGDGGWTIQLGSADVLFNLRDDDVNRHFVGFLRPYQGSAFNTQYNIFIDVLTPATVPPVVVRSPAPNVQFTDHLVNIVDHAFFDSGTPPSGTAIPAVTKEFYRYFPDDFDFINLIYEIPYFQNRDHFAVRNDVRGIGVTLFDNGASYGSPRRLQGISRFPLPTVFDGAEVGYQHELGHQWINFLRGTPLEPGIPHWPLSDLAADIMGLSIPGSNVGGFFPYDLVPDGNDYRVVPRPNIPLVFSDLSLYLMGLLPPEQVKKHVVFNNQNQTAVGGGKLLGPVTMLDANDLVRLLGPRIPDSTQSPKSFKVATILVSRDGLVSENVMRLYEFFSARAEETKVIPYSAGLGKGLTNPFFLSTQKLATLSARVTTLVPPRATLTVASRSVLTGSKLTVAWSDIPSPSAADWFGLYAPEASDVGYLARWTTNGSASGNQTVLLPAGLVGGYFELRLFAGSGSQRLAVSNAFSVVRLELIPFAPTSNDAVTIRLSGIWRDACIPRNPQASVAGNQVRIATFGPAVGGICATVLTPWSLTVPISPLPAGTYQVTVTFEQEALGAGEFTITNP